MKKGLKIALFGLSVAVGGVLGATTGGQETAAALCCSSCETSYNRCVSGCGTDITCLDNCESRYFSCYGYCTPSC